MTDIAALSAEFPQAAVSWRAQTLTKDGTKALALAYIDARDVMERLDAVCGPAGWQCDYPHAGSKTVCRIGIKIGDEWVWKSNGAGDSDIEAEKGALSDAFKRAAVLWGIGRYLYAIPSPWVPCESYEKGGKHYWSKWSGNPWDFVRSSKPAAAQPASAASPAATSVEAYLGFIDSAANLDTLQAFFGEAWKAHPGPNSRQTIKARYEARKTALTPMPATLGAHLDNLERAEKAGASATVPN
jgi:hypothetical protein